MHIEAHIFVVCSVPVFFVRPGFGLIFYNFVNKCNIYPSKERKLEGFHGWTVIYIYFVSLTFKLLCKCYEKLEFLFLLGTANLNI